MKQDKKFLWIYTAILLSFALILIIFAGLTQKTNSKEEARQKKESAGMQQSLVSLTDRNQKLNDRISSLEKDKKFLEEKAEAVFVFFGGDAHITDILIEAYSKKTSGNNQEAMELISEVSKENLTEDQLKIYNKIIGE